MRVTSNGIELEVERFGRPADPTIVLIMGLGAQLILWPDDFCTRLAGAGFQVVRFDNRDCGHSTWLRDAGRPSIPRVYLRKNLMLPTNPAYGLNDMARDVVGLLDALQLDSAHFVGASMGGMITQLLAARHAARVRSATLIMTSSGHGRLPGPSAALRLKLVSGPREKTREAMIRHSMGFWRAIGSPAYPASEDALRDKVERSFDRAFYPSGLMRQLHAIIDSGSRTRLLANINQPTAIIHGDADPLVPVAAAHDLARRIPHASKHIIPGMGHDFPAELLPQIADTITAHARGAELHRTPAAVA